MSFSPTTKNLYNPLSNFENAVVIDTVEAVFRIDTFPGFRFANNIISDTAHTVLFMKAKETHSGIIDIADISWSQIDTVGSGKDERYVYITRGKVVIIDQNTGDK
jgi:predicted polyphosphate/ATP-dependent NAD kinase